MHLQNPSSIATALILLVLTCAAIVDAPVTGFGWHDQQRVIQQLILCLAAGWLIFLTMSTLSKPVFYLLTLVLTCGLLSSTLAAHPDWALKEWSRYAGMMILALCIACAAGQQWFARSLVYVLFVTAFLNAFQFLVFYLMAFATGIQMFNADILFTGFSNPRFLNQFQVLFMPIVAWIALYQWNSAHRYARLLSGLAFISLMVHWCIAFSLGSRGLWLGLAASHLALLLFFPRFWRLLAVQAVAGVLGFLLYQLLFFVIPDWLGQEAWLRSSMRFGLSKRDIIWGIAWQMFLDNPWFGIGPMHFAAQIKPVAAHPHQVILQWLAEWGLFSTLAACVLAAWGMLHGLRILRSKRAEPLDAALWLSIGGALAMAQVDGVFVMPYTETWLAILIGLALARWSASEQQGTPVRPSRQRLQTLTYKALALAVIVILGNVLINEVPTLPQDSQAFMEKHGTGYFPRFWLQGWIPMEKAATP